MQTPAATTSVAAGPEGPLIAGLAITQTVGYGVLYYAFAVLITPIADDLHTSTAAVTGALTTSVLVRRPQRSRSAAGWTATAAGPS